MSVSARCCCGSLSVEVEGEPAFSALCHCDDCKRRTGSAFGWSIYFAPHQVAPPTGRVATYVFDTSMMGRVERSFCPTCGSTMLWRPEGAPGLVGLAGGCFAKNAFAPPTISASDDKRCAWFEPPGDWTRLA